MSPQGLKPFLQATTIGMKYNGMVIGPPQPTQPLWVFCNEKLFEQIFYFWTFHPAQYVNFLTPLPDLKKHTGHSSVPHPSPLEKGQQSTPIATLMNESSTVKWVSQEIPCTLLHVLIDTDKLFCCLFCPTTPFQSNISFITNFLLSGSVGNNDI